MDSDLRACPAWLVHDPDHVALWEQLAPILERKGTLTAATAEMLASFVLNSVTIRQIQASPHAARVIEPNREGMLRVNPILRQLGRLIAENTQLGRKLGLFEKPKRPGKLALTPEAAWVRAMGGEP